MVRDANNLVVLCQAGNEPRRVTRDTRSFRRKRRDKGQKRFPDRSCNRFWPLAVDFFHSAQRLFSMRSPGKTVRALPGPFLEALSKICFAKDVCDLSRQTG